MAVHIQTWTQHAFTRPGIDLYQKDGDYSDLVGLRPDPPRRRLARGPAWAQAPAYPGTFTTPLAAFYDADGSTYVLIGADSSYNMTAVKMLQADWSAWLGPYTLVASVVPGGLTGCNVLWHNGYLYIVGNDGKVYRGTSYQSSLSSFYTTGDAYALAAYADTVFMATTGGTIYKLNTAGSAFSEYYAPPLSLDILFMAAYHQYLFVITRDNDGSIDTHRLPDNRPDTLHHITRTHSTGEYSSQSKPCAIFDDKVYISAGRFPNTTEYKTNLYEFDGSRMTPIAMLNIGARALGTGQTSYPTAILNWQQSLVHATLKSDGAHSFELFTGGGFATFAPLTITPAGGAFTHTIYSVGDKLLANLDPVTETERLYYTDDDNYHASPYLVTSRLAMGRPGQLKRLDTLTVVLDGAASNFDVIVKYRVDDATSWTTATTQDNTRVVTIGDLATEFYLLQIRVDLDDNTGNNEDIGIEAISAIYSARK